MHKTASTPLREKISPWELKDDVSNLDTDKEVRKWPENGSPLTL